MLLTYGIKNFNIIHLGISNAILGFTFHFPKEKTFLWITIIKGKYMEYADSITIQSLN